MAVLVTGAAGFIGSHLVDALLTREDMVIGADNLSRGKIGHLAGALASGRFVLIRLDLADEAQVRERLEPVVARHQVGAIWHLAANSDIAAGQAEASIDLRDTFLSTCRMVALARRRGIAQFGFTSTSAVYGEWFGALREEGPASKPISNYGAMKLASEAALNAALTEGLSRAVVFRLPNVVGARATHGVIVDLLTRLKTNRRRLPVLGDGRQRKPYLHVRELIDAMLYIWERAAGRSVCFNIGPADEGATVAEIAAQVMRAAGVQATIEYTGGTRGWSGEVARFHYCIDKLTALGWRPRQSSSAAIAQACAEVAEEVGPW
ncbi:MAG TPA: NAD-dependent epimerase/dehydratase family protein [Candidatus Binataceae bacterium]|nr:NAD-dependent epimerase/dehydratase family protein [Candidatus Binataceae bacterium]